MRELLVLDWHQLRPACRTRFSGQWFCNPTHLALTRQAELDRHVTAVSRFCLTFGIEMLTPSHRSSIPPSARVAVSCNVQVPRVNYAYHALWHRLGQTSHFNRALPSCVCKHSGPICSTKTCQQPNDPPLYAQSSKLHMMRPRPFESLGCARGLHPRDHQARGDLADYGAKRRVLPTNARQRVVSYCAYGSLQSRRPPARPHLAWFSISTYMRNLSRLTYHNASDPPRAVRGSLRRRQRRLTRAAVVYQSHVGARRGGGRVPVYARTQTCPT